MRAAVRAAGPLRLGAAGAGGVGRGANARGVQFTATAVRRGAAPTQCTLAPPAAVRTASALRAAVLLAVKRSCGGAPWGAALVTPLPLVEQRDATSAEEAASSRPLGPAVLPPDEARHLISTPAQRATVAAWACLEVALLLRAATAPGAAAAAAAAPGATAMALFALVAAAWLAADLAVGLFHFFVDNYGDEHTPVIGHVIAAFQGHHTQPWLITRGQFCTVVEGPCMTQLPLQLAVLACGAGPAGCVFMAAYAAWSVTAQLAHAWSHERRTHLPAAVRVLQDMGILVSCKEHRAHHLPPISDHYCILSGVWNRALDGSGVLRALERAIHATTGAVPRSWSAYGGHAEAQQQHASVRG